MDIDQFFGDTWNQIKEQADKYAPVLQSSVEQWGIEWLQKQNEATQEKANEVIKEVVNSPAAPPGSFSAALQSVFGAGVMQAKGAQILLAVFGIGIFGYFLMSKGK